MKTATILQQAIDDDLIWRRRELSNIRAAISKNENNLNQQSTLLRAGVALLYAHWEGFVKRTGTNYLEFVSLQRKKGSELTPNFIGIKFKTLLDEASKSKKVSSTNEIINFFCTKLDDRLNIPHKGIINTQSNLSSSVLREINSTLGLDNVPYETKKNFIDLSLVDRRNHIAHGSNLDIDKDDYFALHDEVILLLEEFRKQIQNAASTKQFLKSK